MVSKDHNLKIGVKLKNIADMDLKIKMPLFHMKIRNFDFFEIFKKIFLLLGPPHAILKK